ncbi:MAG: hypothetical protein ACKOIB_04475, partial [Verrucomicrobiota bacterium]
IDDGGGVHERGGWGLKMKDEGWMMEDGGGQMEDYGGLMEDGRWKMGVLRRRGVGLRLRFWFGGCFGQSLIIHRPSSICPP